MDHRVQPEFRLALATVDMHIATSVRGRPPVFPRALADARPAAVIMERFDVSRVEVFPEPLEQFLDSPRRGRAPLQKAFGSAAILRGPRPAASHTNRVGPLGLDRRPLLDAHLELPLIAEVV